MASPIEFTIYVVVDDDPLRESICALLRSIRFQVRPFCSVAEFLRTDRPAFKSCLIVDEDMPDVSGFELIAQLRSEGLQTPAIVMMRSPYIKLQPATERLDAVLLEKPCAPGKLIGCLAKALAGTKDK